VPGSSAVGRLAAAQRPTAPVAFGAGEPGTLSVLSRDTEGERGGKQGEKWNRENGSSMK